MHTEPEALRDRGTAADPDTGPGDENLLPAVVSAVQAAGRHLLARFSPEARMNDLQAIVDAIDANDAASLSVLRPRLGQVRPGARWAEDELESGELPLGEWWITDPVEGNINHVHGMTDWAVTATLVRDNRAVLTAVYLPLANRTYTAVRGRGAHMDASRLIPSAKTDLCGALVGTGQAKPGEDDETHSLMGRSVTAMLQAALVVRVSVPATLQLVELAAGRMDAFWQYSQVRSGLLAGALLVEEAGGIVTDLRGDPWTLASDGFLATAPGLHTAALGALSTVS